MAKTLVVIDGFNLYNGVVCVLGCKWVDLKTYLLREFPDDDLYRVVFCTSWVDGTRRANQRTYVDALTASGVEVRYGKFENRSAECGVNSCTHSIRTFHRKTEKRTDVLIASVAVAAAASKECEKVVLVTADSDLVPCVEVLSDFGVFTHVLLPTMPESYLRLEEELKGTKMKGYYAHDLKRVASKSSVMNMDAFLQSQFEETVEFNGTKHTIPRDWAIQSESKYRSLLVLKQRRVDEKRKLASHGKSAEEQATAALKKRLGLAE